MGIEWVIYGDSKDEARLFQWRTQRSLEKLQRNDADKRLARRRPCLADRLAERLRAALAHVRDRPPVRPDSPFHCALAAGHTEVGTDEEEEEDEREEAKEPRLGVVFRRWFGRAESLTRMHGELIDAVSEMTRALVDLTAERRPTGKAGSVATLEQLLAHSPAKTAPPAEIGLQASQLGRLTEHWRLRGGLLCSFWVQTLARPPPRISIAGVAGPPSKYPSCRSREASLMVTRQWSGAGLLTDRLGADENGIVVEYLMDRMLADESSQLLLFFGLGGIETFINSYVPTWSLTADECSEVMQSLLVLLPVIAPPSADKNQRERRPAEETHAVGSGCKEEEDEDDEDDGDDDPDEQYDEDDASHQTWWEHDRGDVDGSFLSKLIFELPVIEASVICRRPLVVQ